MRIRKLMIGLAAAGIVASMFGAVGAHDKIAACNGDITAHEVGDQIIYTDFREELPNINHWVYLEDNGHEWLQTGGDHAVLGEGGGSIGFTDPCVNNEDDHASIDKDSILL